MKFTFLIISLLSSLFVTAQKNQYEVVADSFFLSKKFDGVILVGLNNRIVYQEATGIGDRQNGKKITPDSRFKIASLTKTFTAALIMKLVEDGKINLNDVIGKHLKDYNGEAKDKVTIHHLLTYSAGIPDCEGGNGMTVYKEKLPLNDFIEKFCSGNLESEPGKKFNYNNSGYIILGKIIEVVTGSTFEKFLHKTILQPLKMYNTGTATLGDRDILPSYTYDDSLTTIYPDEPYFIENFFAAGSMYSTVSDLYAFNKALFEYRILKKSSVDLMIKPNPDLQNVGYGFWFSNGFGSFSRDFVYRPGGILGSTANWIHEIEKKRTVIILSNTNQANLFELSSLLAAVQSETK